MGKNQTSIVVVQIQQLWRMILMGVKDKCTKIEQECQRWDQVLQVADLGSKICQKWPKKALLCLV